MAGLKLNKKVTVREIARYFHLRQMTGDDSSLDRVVTEPDINRPGFELSGYVRRSDPQRIVIMGNKEIEYIKLMARNVQRPRFMSLLNLETPMIIISNDNPLPDILKDVADENNFPVFLTAMETSRLMVDLISFLDESLAVEDTVHGVFVVVYDKGILLTGDSGIGKSETALELIRSGHSLVADDRVDILRVHNTLKGMAPELLRGMLEVRGIGIIDVVRMYGATSMIRRHNIDMVVHLTPFDENKDYDRLGDLPTVYTNLLDVEIPTIELPVSPGRSTSVLVESAVMNFILQEEGYNSSAMFKERVRSHLIHINEENQKGKNDDKGSTV